MEPPQTDPLLCPVHSYQPPPAPKKPSWRWSVRVGAIATLALCPCRLWAPLLSYGAVRGLSRFVFRPVESLLDKPALQGKTAKLLTLVPIICWIACLVFAQIHPLYGLAAGAAAAIVDLMFLSEGVHPFSKPADSCG